MTAVFSTALSERHLKMGLQLFYWLQLFLWIWAFQVWAGEESFGYAIRWGVISFPFKILLFYSYFYFFIPRWLGKRNGYLIGMTLLILLVYPPLKYLVDQWAGIHSIQSVVMQVDDDSNALPFDIDYLEWFRRVITVGLNVSSAFVVRFMVDWFRNRKVQAQMERLQLQSELAMLRNQVNPHFLFNTLNNIDAMVYKVSSQASEAIVKLAAIMRYMLYESNTEWVSLSKEAEYLKSYFDLQQMRFIRADQVRLEVQLEDPEIKIAPMIFISFVENAFKHAVDLGAETLVHCELRQSGQVIVLKVTNSFDPEVTMEKDSTSGIGIQNVTRRLELIYPGKHSLEVSPHDQKYVVILTIEAHDH